MSGRSWKRREFMQTTVLGGAAMMLPGRSGDRTLQTGPLRRRAIPSTGEEVPVVGMGTWQTFDVGNAPGARDDIREVLRRFVREGGALLDSSPMYGRSEEVLGDLAADLGVQEELFWATKVWTRGGADPVRQMEDSFRQMRVETMDLMQVHNLVDLRRNLGIIRRWKEQGRIRYIGITHYVVSMHDELMTLLREEELDFVQFNYNIAVREGEEALLPLAADRGVAVLINRPYRGGELFGRVRGRDLPDWAAEFDCASWGQFFLKYILAHPAVTCVIPATSDPEHLVDNMGAGRGGLPDEATRRRMVRYLEEA